MGAKRTVRVPQQMGPLGYWKLLDASCPAAFLVDTARGRPEGCFGRAHTYSGPGMGDFTVCCPEWLAAGMMLVRNACTRVMQKKGIHMREAHSLFGMCVRYK